MHIGHTLCLSLPCYNTKVQCFPLEDGRYQGIMQQLIKEAPKRRAYTLGSLKIKFIYVSIYVTCLHQYLGICETFAFHSMAR